MPGTYITGVDRSSSDLLAETATTFGNTSTTAAKPWADLSAVLRARTAFIHRRTYTNAHPEMSKVLAGHGSVTSFESNIIAAVALLRMNITPVVSVNIPFGRDTHADGGSVVETAESEYPDQDWCDGPLFCSDRTLVYGHFR